jgi:hypothetical protein
MEHTSEYVTYADYNDACVITKEFSVTQECNSIYDSNGEENDRLVELNELCTNFKLLGLWQYELIVTTT